MPRGAKKQNAARRNRLPPPPPLTDEQKMIKLYVWHVSREHPNITEIRVPCDAPLFVLRHSIRTLWNYRGEVTLLDDVRELNDDDNRLDEYELFDGDIVRVVDRSVASSSAASSSAARA